MKFNLEIIPNSIIIHTFSLYAHTNIIYDYDQAKKEKKTIPYSLITKLS